MSNDSFGDRMKRYESVSRNQLMPNMPVAIRVDGRAFHSWTKNLSRIRPFNHTMMSAMDRATAALINEVDGFIIGYTQSDEATVIIDDSAAHKTNPWFGNDHSKIVSIAASKMTAAFNKEIRDMGNNVPDALFDARAFNIPHAEVLNCILWRMKDWKRNSVQMFAGHFFSRNQLHKKGVSDMTKMLGEYGISWDNDLEPREKYGKMFVVRKNADERKSVHEMSIEPSYANLSEMAFTQEPYKSLYS